MRKVKLSKITQLSKVMEPEADLGLDLGPPDFEADDLCKNPPCPSQLPPVWGAVGVGGGNKVYMKKFCIFYKTLAGIVYDSH